MYPHYHNMIVDKATITTRIRPHPDLVVTPVTFIREHTRQVRYIKLSRGQQVREPLGSPGFVVPQVQR